MSTEAACSSLVGLVTSAVQVQGRVALNERVARDTWRIKVDCPALARQIIPGQFFMVRDPGGSDPLLGRPFALLDVYDDETGQPLGVEFGYIVVGKLTRRMTTWQAGDPCSLWGPLGNGFPLIEPQRLLLVAGGIGQTPFMAVARELTGQRRYGTQPRSVRQPGQITLCYGVRSSEHQAFIDAFRQTGIDVRLSTDDGSADHPGLVTDLVSAALAEPARPDAIFCCGPEPMMAAVARIAETSGVRCWLSLESPMACGFGICFSCVTRVKQDDGSWDYHRTCVEGPVFEAEKLCL